MTMKTRVSSRKPANIPDSIRQHLHTYALAASAAGVTMLALAPLGEAEIVYTPANVNITPYERNYTLDVNGDGITDFTFFDTTYPPIGSLWVSGAGSAANGVALRRSGRFQNIGAAALRSGHRIGPKTRFRSSGRSLLMAEGYQGIYPPYPVWCAGPWKDKQDRYLGLKFMIGSEIHYGWARLSETCSHGDWQTAVLTGYAYETIPNQPIKAGQEQGTDNGVEQPDSADLSQPAQSPATLGMLARGARERAAWRRRQPAVQQQDAP
jgi:hypothetical protein